MTKTKYITAFVAVLLALAFAGLAQAQILQLNPAGTITVPTCSVSGGSSVSVPDGYYELHVSGETANVCYASTCASGGMERVKGNHGGTYFKTESGTTSVSSRSAGGTAVVQFVPGRPVKSY